MIQIFQTPIARPSAAALLLVAVLVVLAGCGLQTGYTPDKIPVHRGQGLAEHLAPVDSLTVVSWNIQYGRNVDLAVSEMQANPRLAAADIVLLQEMDPVGSERVAKALGFYFVHGSAYVHPKHKRLFGNAVLSRWPIVNDQVLILPHETLLTGHRRIAVAADIDLGEGRTVRAISLHTSTMIMEQDKRIAQARAVGDSLGGLQELMVIGGDFNTVSVYEVNRLRQTMRRLGLQSARLPSGPTISNRFKKLPGSTPVLDHLFSHGLEATDTGVDRTTTASDHYPIWAVFRLQN
ncbi:MAG: endonuclease/exonuclease/phosphatase family protein [Candidatus Krumholzibacteria bacterium]|nr:endonuclease/exonuclease/phosphatase family protein [Candidatus Krumholzibacteria bacterium]